MDLNGSSQDKHTRWNERIKQWEASGKSVAGWCREHAVNENQFYYWRSRLAELANPKFIELQEPEGKATGVAVELKDARVHLSRGFDIGTFQRLLAVLRKA